VCGGNRGSGHVVVTMVVGVVVVTVVVGAAVVTGGGFCGRQDLVGAFCGLVVACSVYSKQIMNLSILFSQSV
jgi:hypothetical protein